MLNNWAQDISRPLPEWLDTIECIIGEQWPDNAIAQGDVNLYILCKLEGTFSLKEAHFFFSFRILLVEQF